MGPITGGKFLDQLSGDNTVRVADLELDTGG
jgi:hypothetical protein